MAARQRKGGPSGRATPKGGTPKATGAKAPAAKVGANKARTKASPRRNPLEYDEPVSVGHRPSSAGFLAVVAVMWLAVGVVLFVTLTSGWKLIPAIVAFGIGLMFLRGSVTTVLRREHRRSSDR